MDPSILNRNFCKIIITRYGIKFKAYIGIIRKKFPTDSNKIRQTKVEQRFTPKILQIMLDIV